MSSSSSPPIVALPSPTETAVFPSHHLRGLNIISDAAFPALRDTTWCDIGALNVLTGRNGTGKSQLLRYLQQRLSADFDGIFERDAARSSAGGVIIFYIPPDHSFDQVLRSNSPMKPSSFVLPTSVDRRRQLANVILNTFNGVVNRAQQQVINFGDAFFNMPVATFQQRMVNLLVDMWAASDSKENFSVTVEDVMTKMDTIIEYDRNSRINSSPFSWKSTIRDCEHSRTQPKSRVS